MSTEMIDAWYAAIRAADPHALDKAATQDVQVDWNGPVGLIPWAGRWHGKAQVMSFFANVAAHLEVLSIETIERIDMPQAAVIILQGHWRVRANGAFVRARALNLFRFEDGKITSYQVYPDSHAFAAALMQA
jgi:uncharacterized protein